MTNNPEKVDALRQLDADLPSPPEVEDPGPVPSAPASSHAFADGPTEAHKVNLAKMILRGYQPEDPEWPSEFLERRVAAAKVKYQGRLADIPSLPGPSR